MKTVISVAKYLLFIILVAGFVVLGSKAVRDKLFYSSGLVPKEVFTLSAEISASSPEDTSEKRIELLKAIDDFTKGSVSGNGFSSKIYSLIKTRLDQALREISTTQVPKGKLKIWYVYNMGVIAKTEAKTIAFDLAGTAVYANLADFAKHIDVLVITHFHNDHFDLPVVKAALKNGATVIIPGDKTLFKGNDLVRDHKGEDAVSLLKKRSAIDSENFISLQPQEKTTVKGIEITAYPAKHVHSPEEEDSFMDTPVNWYLVNLAGLKILHMGDGTSFDYQPDFPNKNIDVFITHSTAIDPRTKDNLLQLVPNAKTILPLHVLELGHGPNIVNEKHDWYMNYQSILDNYANGYYKGLQGKTRFMPMIWGESILF